MDKNRKSEQVLSFMEPYGLWEVSTEGDCEGRSVRKLGIFRGNYQDIAFALADKCYYVLHFKRLDENEFNLPKARTRKVVELGFKDALDVNHKDMAKEVGAVLADETDIIVEPGRWNGCVKLTSTSKDECLRSKAMEKIRNTLSEEEMKALGF